MRDRWPKPPLRGGYRFDINSQLEKAAKTAERATTRPLRRQPIRIDGQRYIAFDAHQIIERASDEERARPGHPLG